MQNLVSFALRKILVRSFFKYSTEPPKKNVFVMPKKHELPISLITEILTLINISNSCNSLAVLFKVNAYLL